MRGRIETILWLAQRLSAVVLILGAVVHVATNVYAVRGGLGAAEVIARIQGNGAWLTFYLLFALAAAVHVPLGLRTVLVEMTPIKACRINVATAGFGLIVLWLGWRAAFGLFGYGGA